MSRRPVMRRRTKYADDLDLFKHVEQLAGKYINIRFLLKVPPVKYKGKIVFDERRISVNVSGNMVRAPGLFSYDVPLMLLMGSDQPWRRIESKVDIITSGPRGDQVIKYNDEGVGIVELLGSLHQTANRNDQDDEYAMYIGAALGAAIEHGDVEPVPVEDLANDVATQYYEPSGTPGSGAGRVPTEKDLIENFGDYWSHDGLDPDLQAFRLRVDWIGAFNDGADVDDVLGLVNSSIEGHGVEYITMGHYAEPIAAYVNMGDAYAATVVYNYDTRDYVLTDYGSFLEEWEREHPDEAEELRG